MELKKYIPIYASIMDRYSIPFSDQCYTVGKVPELIFPHQYEPFLFEGPMDGRTLREDRWLDLALKTR